MTEPAEQLNTGRVHVLTGHTNDVNCCDFSCHGLLASCSSDKSVRVWRYETSGDEFCEQSYSPLTYHTYSVHYVRFSPGGDHLLTCSTDGSAVLWSVKAGVIAATLRHVSAAPLRCCCFSSSGRTVATAADDALICLWSTDDAALVTTLRQHDDTVTCVAFSNNSYDSSNHNDNSSGGPLLASGSTNGQLLLWRPWRLLAPCVATVDTAHDLGVTSCHFLPHTVEDCVHVLATCGHDVAVRLWRVLPIRPASDGGVSGGCMVAPWRQLWRGAGTTMMVRFTHDGHWLAAAAGDKTVVLWHTSEWRVVARVTGHSRYVTSCCVSPDGRWLASGSNDRSVRVLSLAAGRQNSGGVISSDSAATVAATADNRSFERIPAIEWDCAQVAQWLRSLALSQYAATFGQHNIDGSQLLQLTEQQLAAELGVESVGHRSKLMRHIGRAADGGINDAVNPPPDEFYCPITRDVMCSPVVCSDGYSYEQAAIEAWLQRQSTSPMTNEPINKLLLFPNHALRSLIGQWRNRRGQ